MALEQLDGVLAMAYARRLDRNSSMDRSVVVGLKEVNAATIVEWQQHSGS